MYQLPTDPQAEINAIAFVLSSPPSLYKRILPLVNPEDFTVHGKEWAAILKLDASGVRVNDETMRTVGFNQAKLSNPNAYHTCIYSSINGLYQHDAFRHNRSGYRGGRGSSYGIAFYSINKGKEKAIGLIIALLQP